MKNKPQIFLFAGLVALGIASSALAAPTSKATIKKCQDATGKWHYGDTAADACARSNVSVMNEHGITKKTIDAPLTQEQIKAREQQNQDQVKAEEQRKRDQLLLATYGSEADITYIRDRKLAQLESVIRASKDTLKPLQATLGRLEAQAATEAKSGGVMDQTVKALEQTRQQIAKHESTIEQKRQEQEQIRVRSEEDLKRYRALKAQAQPAGGQAGSRAN